MKNLSAVIPEYERRVASGMEWPGLIHNLRDYVPEKPLPDTVHFLDKKTLKRVLESQGFKIEKMSYIERRDFPPDRWLDGRESIGVIARKPLRR